MKKSESVVIKKKDLERLLETLVRMEEYADDGVVDVDDPGEDYQDFADDVKDAKECIRFGYELLNGKKPSECTEYPIGNSVFNVYVSELRYGHIRVAAKSEKEAVDFATNMYANERLNIRWHDYELTDVSAGG